MCYYFEYAAAEMGVPGCFESSPLSHTCSDLQSTRVMLTSLLCLGLHVYSPWNENVHVVLIASHYVVLCREFDSVEIDPSRAFLP
jgi:hypothetical protein